MPEVFTGPVVTDVIIDDAAQVVDNQGFAYTDYMCFNRYIDNPFIYMSPITSPDGFQNQGAVFMQLAKPTLVVACEWTAARWGTAPQIPDPTLIDQDWIFLGKTPETAMAPLGADGQSPLYRISGTYYYGRKNPSSNTFSQMVFPRPAWAENSYNRTISTGILEQNIIDGATAGGGGGGGLNNPVAIGLLTGFATLG